MRGKEQPSRRQTILKDSEGKTSTIHNLDGSFRSSVLDWGIFVSCVKALLKEALKNYEVTLFSEVCFSLRLFLTKKSLAKGSLDFGIKKRNHIVCKPAEIVYLSFTGKNRQSPIASVQRTRSTPAGHSAIPHGANVKRMNANHAIQITAQ